MSKRKKKNGYIEHANNATASLKELIAGHQAEMAGEIPAWRGDAAGHRSQQSRDP
jgi:hypothetical protein